MGNTDSRPEARFVSGNRETVYRDPARVVCAKTLAEVLPALNEVRAAVAAGHTAAGFLAYEASPAFDLALVAHPPNTTPLLWFGLFDNPTEEIVPGDPSKDFTLGPWKSTLEPESYRNALARIREYIAAGDTYQVNYTFPLEATFQGDALAWFRQLCRAQRTPYGTYIDTGEHQIISASPELFFALSDNKIVTRPMKGTRPRAVTQADDLAQRDALAASEKDRAENVMIVDMLRNDLARIADGAVTTSELFTAERYPTVWQMTSTIEANTRADVSEILAALFPCGSVTGAPKYRTTEIIRELESEPRGVYCGALGWWAPNRTARFSVGIRTAVHDAKTGTVRYHTGSGVTWDSDSTEEYKECQHKATVLAYAAPRFQLLETILFDQGYHLLREHLDRLEQSAAYFGYPCQRETITQKLARRATAFAGQAHRVRLLLDEDGTTEIDATPYCAEDRVFQLAVTKKPVDRRNVFLYHKTTHRAVYAEAREGLEACDDVILWNAAGEITETTIGNLVLEMSDGRRCTPPVSSGLLAGTFRRHLLAHGEIEEAILRVEDLKRARQIWVINSVRGWIFARLSAG